MITQNLGHQAAPSRRLVLGQLGLSLLLAAGLGSVAGAARAQTSSEQQILVDRARSTVESFTAQPDMDTMRHYLARARAVLVFPQILKAGFFVGGQGGSGVLLARDPATGAWSSPAFYTLGGGSLGLQFGAEASEVMLLIMNSKALNAIINNQVKLGADASIAVGPLGKGVEAATTTALNQDILSFARSKGLFAGVSVAGAVINARNSWNQLYYGRKVTAGDVVLRRQAEASGATALIGALRQAER